MVDTLRPDVVLALRSLRRNPGFSAVVVLTLALGIGANTAIFSLLNAIVFRQLPVRNPGELVEVLSRGQSGEARSGTFSREAYEHYRDGNDVFSDLVATSLASVKIRTPTGSAESVNGAYVTGNFFSALGLIPTIGRLIGPHDDRRGESAAAVVLSWSYWQRAFAGDPSVLGRSIVVNEMPAVVIGVASRAFMGLQVGTTTDVWIPAAKSPDPGPQFSNQFIWQLMGRLKPGVSIEQAAANMRVLDRWRLDMLARTSGDRGWHQVLLQLEPAGAGFSPLREAFVNPLSLLLVLVGLLLAIACTNVASMLLARSAARQKEMAVRVSLGAGRIRLVRQVVTESMIFAVFGTLCATVVAYLSARGLVQIVASGRRMAGLVGRLEVPVEADARVLVFTASVTIVTGLLVGIAPAWAAFRSMPASALRGTGNSGHSRSIVYSEMV